MDIKSIQPTGTLLSSELEMAIWVNRVSVGIEEYLGKALNRTQKAVLAELAESGQISLLNKRQFDKLLKLMEAIGQDYMREPIQQALDEISEMPGLAASAEAYIIGRMTGEAVKRISEAFKLAVETPIAATGDLLEPFVKGLEDTVIDRLQKEIRISMATGRTLNETVASLKSLIETMKKRDVEAVISTATQHAFNVARDAVYEVNGIDKVRCVATLDVRVCMYCAALDGKVVERSKAPKYPLHPRCRCLTVPEIEGLDELREGATRSSEDGYVPQSMSAFEYLRSKPMDELKEAYGPTVAAAIKSQGMTTTKFRQLALDKGLKPISITELKERMERRGML